jgi:uncharacterized OB-fold protein
MAYAWKPQLNYDTKDYWEGCARKELIIARCQDCKYWIHPPKALCPVCWSDNIGREKASGEATIFTFTVMPPRGEGGRTNVTVWAELAEQARLFLIGDLEEGYVEGIEIGDPLNLVWVDFHGSVVLGFRRKTSK